MSEEFKSGRIENIEKQEQAIAEENQIKNNTEMKNQENKAINQLEYLGEDLEDSIKDKELRNQLGHQLRQYFNQKETSKDGKIIG